MSPHDDAQTEFLPAIPGYDLLEEIGRAAGTRNPKPETRETGQ